MTEKEKYIDDITALLNNRDILEALAEESAELTQASLKLIRAIGLSNNKTPKCTNECFENLKEEIADVLMVLAVLGIELPNIENNPKWERWFNRLK